MPCRKENYIFLEQSVTVDSKEVDALVTKIGEALQLHNNSSGVGCCGIKPKPKPTAACNIITTATMGAPVQKQQQQQQQQQRNGCCMRLRRNHQHRNSSRSSPYHIPGSNVNVNGHDLQQEWDQIKPWNRKKKQRIMEEQDDPHRLLQELILSGNLIKEAVRRLQFSAADCADFPQKTSAAADGVAS